jgi:transposase InsO family protein
LVTALKQSLLSIDALRQAQMDEPHLRHKIERLEKMSKNQRHNNYLLRKGILMYEAPQKPDELIHPPAVVCVPNILQHVVLAHYHGSPAGVHLGSKKMHALMQLHFHWTNMARVIKDYCGQCTVCQHCKPNRHPGAPRVRHYQPTRPNEIVSIDLVGPLVKSLRGKMYILTMIDNFTKYALAVPLVSKNSEGVARAFVDSWATNIGIPSGMISDQGTDVHSPIMQYLSMMLGVQKTITASFSPQSNAYVERFHSTLKGMLRSALFQDDIRLWCQYLPFLLMSYNETPHSASGIAPALLMKGQLPSNHMLPLIPKDHPALSTSEFLKALHRSQEIYWAIAKERVLRERKKRTALQGAKATKEYQVGDLVLVRAHHRLGVGQAKLNPMYEGPYHVTQVHGNTIRVVRLLAPGAPRAPGDVAQVPLRNDAQYVTPIHARWVHTADCKVFRDGPMTPTQRLDTQLAKQFLNNLRLKPIDKRATAADSDDGDDSIYGDPPTPPVSLHGNSSTDSTGNAGNNSTSSEPNSSDSEVGDPNGPRDAPPVLPVLELDPDHPDVQDPDGPHHEHIGRGELSPPPPLRGSQYRQSEADRNVHRRGQSSVRAKQKPTDTTPRVRITDSESTDSEEDKRPPGLGLGQERRHLHPGNIAAYRQSLADSDNLLRTTQEAADLLSRINADLQVTHDLEEEQRQARIQVQMDEQHAAHQLRRQQHQTPERSPGPSYGQEVSSPDVTASPALIDFASGSKAHITHKIKQSQVSQTLRDDRKVRQERRTSPAPTGVTNRALAGLEQGDASVQFRADVKQQQYIEGLAALEAQHEQAVTKEQLIQDNDDPVPELPPAPVQAAEGPALLTDQEITDAESNPLYGKGAQIPIGRRIAHSPKITAPPLNVPPPIPTRRTSPAHSVTSSTAGPTTKRGQLIPQQILPRLPELPARVRSSTISSTSAVQHSPVATPPRSTTAATPEGIAAYDAQMERATPSSSHHTTTATKRSTKSDLLSDPAFSFAE